MKEPFLKAVPLLEKIEAAGYEAYFVGGSVRDFLLNKPIHDVDIATSAEPNEIKQIFKKTVDVGIEHGTILVIYNEESYEITTFRSESEYEDFRRPKSVQFIRSLFEDLKRRDFTINAIAMSKSGQITDPFQGQEDLTRKTIRTVGNPKDRFTEDALRMMRAVRFVSQLSFDLEESTYQALKEYGPLLEHIAVERKLVEFEKLLVGKSRSSAILILLEQNLHHYLPGLSSYGEQLRKLASLCKKQELEVNQIWALLLHLIETDEVEDFLRKWKMSVKQMKDIKQIKLTYEWRLTHDWDVFSVYRFGLQYCLQAEMLFSLTNGYVNTDINKIEAMYESLPIKNRKQLVVTGHDLMQWEKVESGPWIKEKLEKIEMAIVLGEVENDKERIKEWLYS